MIPENVAIAVSTVCVIVDVLAGLLAVLFLMGSFPRNPKV